MLLLLALQMLAACNSIDERTVQPLPGWLHKMFVGLLFVCACALLIGSDALAGRVQPQNALVRRVLHDSFTGPFNAMPLWNDLQRSHECCGMYNASDWNSDALPLSCCAGAPAVVAPSMFVGHVLVVGVRYSAEMGCRMSAPVHPIGCIAALEQYVRNATKWLTWCAFVFACLAILCAFIACATDYERIGGASGTAAAAGQRQQRPMRPNALESMA